MTLQTSAHLAILTPLVYLVTDKVFFGSLGHLKLDANNYMFQTE